jgi:hypothetical protein
MKRNLTILLVMALLCPVLLFANDYEDAWKALHRNDRKKAGELLERAMTNPQTAVDAYLTWIFLQQFEGKERSITDFSEKAYSKIKDPNPYLFSLWFNSAVLGAYGKKTLPHQLTLLDKILKDPACNGSMKAAAHYVKGMHNLMGNELQKHGRSMDK